VYSGQFVCEYAGEVLSECDADERFLHGPEGRDAYLFNLPLMPECAALGAQCDFLQDESGLVIDAYSMGNIARFLNHACGPSHCANVTPVYVYTRQLPAAPIDARLPRVGLFANRAIGTGEELRYDYCMQPGEVSELDGTVRSLSCHCGSRVCRGRLY